MSHIRSTTWLRLSVLYYILAVCIDIAMGASGNHMLMPVHAHLNLLGWVSMTLFALIGHSHPAVHEGRVASVQVWSYNLGVPLMLAALALRLNGIEAAEPAIGMASIAIGVGVVLFGWQVLTRTRTIQAAPPTALSAGITQGVLASR